MRRRLVTTPAYLRSLRRFTKKHPRDADAIRNVLELLEADALRPSLKSHKLHGKLSDVWACSGGYDLRILFMFEVRDDETIVLLRVGTHDELY